MPRIYAALPDGRSPTWDDALVLNIGVGVVPELRLRFSYGDDPEDGYLPAVHMHLQFHFYDARYVADFVGLQAHDVTGSDIREIRVAELVRLGSAAGIFASFDGEPHQSLLDADYVQKGTQRPPAVRVAGPPAPETLRDVAFAYQMAQISSQPPAKAVEQLFGLPPRTAARWIARARSDGYLVRPSVPGWEKSDELVHLEEAVARDPLGGVREVTAEDLNGWGLENG